MSWLKRSVAAVKGNNSTARTTLEALLAYPGLHALFWHHLPHFLYRRQLFLLARIYVQFWRFVTGVEVHLGATIGAEVFIDHGMGIVIGGATEIGEDVILFHGVTLGGTGRDTGKRHPAVKKGTMILTRTQILGPVVIGEHPKIDTGAVVTSDIPADTIVVGAPARVVRLDGRKVERGHD